MKTLMKVFFVIFSLCLFHGPASADDGISSQWVPEIHLKGIDSSSAGLNLTVFYVSGRGEVLENFGHDLSVRSTLKSVTQAISGTTMTIPKATVAPQGFKVLNYLVIAIHRQPRLFLQRPNGEVVNDQRLQGQTPDKSELSFIRLGHISLADFLRLKNPSQDFIQLDIKKDLQ